MPVEASGKTRYTASEHVASDRGATNSNAAADCAQRGVVSFSVRTAKNADALRKHCRSCEPRENARRSSGGQGRDGAKDDSYSTVWERARGLCAFASRDVGESIAAVREASVFREPSDVGRPSVASSRGRAAARLPGVATACECAVEPPCSREGESVRSSTRHRGKTPERFLPTERQRRFSCRAPASNEE